MACATSFPGCICGRRQRGGIHPASAAARWASSRQSTTASITWFSTPPPTSLALFPTGGASKGVRRCSHKKEVVLPREGGGAATARAALADPSFCWGNSAGAPAAIALAGASTALRRSCKGRTLMLQPVITGAASWRLRGLRMRSTGAALDHLQSCEEPPQMLQGRPTPELRRATTRSCKGPWSELHRHIVGAPNGHRICYKAFRRSYMQ